MRSKKLLITSFILLFNLASALDYELQDGFINLSIDNGLVWYHPKIQSAAAASAHSIEHEKIGYVDKNSDGKYILEIDKRLKKFLGLEESKEIIIDNKLAVCNGDLVGFISSEFSDNSDLLAKTFEIKLSSKKDILENFMQQYQPEKFSSSFTEEKIFEEVNCSILSTYDFSKFNMPTLSSTFSLTPIRIPYLLIRSNQQITNPTKSNFDQS